MQLLALPFLSWLGMMTPGDQNSGFRVDVESDDTVRVVGWGFWSSEEAQSFGSTVMDSLRRHTRGGRVIFDLSQLKPMRDESQHVFSQLLSSAKWLGVADVRIVTTSPLIRLQLMRIVKEAGLDRIVMFI